MLSSSQSFEIICLNVTTENCFSQISSTQRKTCLNYSLRSSLDKYQSDNSSRVVHWKYFIDIYQYHQSLWLVQSTIKNTIVQSYYLFIFANKVTQLSLFFLTCWSLKSPFTICSCFQNMCLILDVQGYIPSFIYWPYPYSQKFFKIMWFVPLSLGNNYHIFEEK